MKHPKLDPDEVAQVIAHLYECRDCLTAVYEQVGEGEPDGVSPVTWDRVKMLVGGE